MFTKICVQELHSSHISNKPKLETTQMTIKVE